VGTLECRADPISEKSLVLPRFWHEDSQMSRWEIRIAIVIGGLVLGLTPSAGSAVVQPGLAVVVLETLAVKGRAPKTGNSRELFGQAWADVDRNGCDTRNDILKRD